MRQLVALVIKDAATQCRHLLGNQSLVQADLRHSVGVEALDLEKANPKDQQQNQDKGQSDPEPSGSERDP
ncbi:hypothetical protein GCM10009784_23490 [Arthrobacter parietis]|uniref:Uncharacterized protein n=1 Tax=Arthrobacter parietis TaxID=271434 RepID=A0ABN3AZB2_9MICC